MYKNEDRHHGESGDAMTMMQVRFVEMNVSLRWRTNMQENRMRNQELDLQLASPSYYFILDMDKIYGTNSRIFISIPNRPENSSLRTNRLPFAAQLPKAAIFRVYTLQLAHPYPAKASSIVLFRSSFRLFAWIAVHG